MKKVPLSNFIPGVIWFFIVLILIVIPQKDIPKVDDWYHRIYIDKWVHAFMFGVLALGFMWPYYKYQKTSPTVKRILVNISISTIVWSYLTECIQFFIPGRSYDLIDWLADSFGVLVVLYFFLKKIRTQY